MALAKTQRNAELIAAYLAGVSYRNLSLRFGISEGRCCRIVLTYVPPEVRAVRGAPPSTPLRHNRGRRPIWPDCPPHLIERYTKMKNRIPAAKARDLILRREALRREIEGMAA